MSLVRQAAVQHVTCNNLSLVAYATNGGSVAKLGRLEWSVVPPVDRLRSSQGSFCNEHACPDRTWLETPVWLPMKLYAALEAVVALSFNDVFDAHQSFPRPLRISDAPDY